MSFDITWSIDKYKDDHECEDHWELRKAFMEHWKHEYPEERLVCLGRVFANMEFMGCRYPIPLMQEVTRLSTEIVTDYRKSKKNKSQRTFVSASTAAEDRAKGVKRKGGVITDISPQKSAKINFVPQSQSKIENSDENDNEQTENENDENGLQLQSKKKSSEVVYTNDYLNEMSEVECLKVIRFNEDMFETTYGRMVLLIRPWTSKFSNIQASCSVCHLAAISKYENNCFTFSINGKLVAQATGQTKAEAKSIVEIMAWNRLKEEVVSVVVKEQWIAQGQHVTLRDISGASDAVFGTPIENSVATKMMQMMGWKGGGLGADAQGIAEPIKPNLQMVNRAGLGSDSRDVRNLRKAAHSLMRRFIASDAFDLDLVFTSDFSKEERAVLHQCAQKSGLASKSYGDKDKDRVGKLRNLCCQLNKNPLNIFVTGKNTAQFLVVKKKLDPFSLVRAVVQKGGVTPKYQVFIPLALDRRRKC